MPLYDYLCQTCGHRCELLEKISDTPAVDCPACQQPKLQRQVSAPQFQLKGSGWYVTDFKKDNKPASTSNETSAKTSD
jgi:putative FmdB family regulatory protein